MMNIKLDSTWIELGATEPQFLSQMSTALSESGLPWKLEKDQSECDVYFELPSEVAFGFKVSCNAHYERIGDCNDENASEIEIFLHRMTDEVLENDDYGGAGVGLWFIHKHDGYDKVYVGVFFPVLEKVDEFLDEYPTREYVVSECLGTLERVSKYLSMKAPELKKLL